MKRKHWLILSFIIPLITYILIFYSKGLFNDKMILNSDMEAQYFPLFNYLKDVLNGDSSIFYNMNKGIGGTMYGTTFYYLSSPFNLLLIFINKDYIHIFMLILVIIKLSLCGFSMYIYMSHKFKEDNFKILVFSLAYAFMGYNLNYYINIMWFDVVILAPIILIGIDNIIDNKSPILYIITLFLAIFSNYYIAYMVCIFSVLYFIYELLLKYGWKENKDIIKKISIKFILISLFTGLMCSFIFIPSLIEILNTPREETSLLLFNPNYFNLFFKSFIGSLNLNNPLNDDFINIYCGIIMLPLTILFITNKNIDKKEKFLTLIILLIFILPIFFPYLNYIWHLFTYPICFNYRYSFLFCLFLITTGYKSLQNNYLKKQYIIIYLISYTLLSILFLYALKITGGLDFLDYKKIIITDIILIINCIALVYIKNINKRQLIICIVLLIEFYLNIFLIFKPHNFQNNSINELSKKVDLVKQNCNRNYRCEINHMNNIIMRNGSLYKNYSSLSIFLSTINKQYIFLNKMTSRSMSNMFTYYYNDNIINSLLGVKTINSTEKITHYNIINTFDYNDRVYYIYNNPLALNLGFMIRQYNKDINYDNINYGPQYQNAILNTLLSTNHEYYTKINLIKTDKNIYQANLTNIDSQYLYLRYNDIAFPSNVYVNNAKINSFISDNYIIIDNIYNDIIEIKLDKSDTLDDIDDIDLYYFNYDLFEYTIEELQKNQLDIEINNNNYIKGNINVSSDKTTLMLTLPYEKGWYIYVDGVKNNYYEVLDTFIGLDLNDGEHTIEMYYKQPGLKIGISISILSFISLITYLYIEKKKIF